jgi:hypothetical protein
MDNSEIKKADQLTAKVAAILTERELIINIGSKDGVKKGMKFKILSNEPFEVKDPTTGVNLGIVDREKVRVSVSEINEKFTICQTYRKLYYPGIGFTIANFANYFPSREVPETLKITDSSLPKPLSEEESYVKVGDRAIQLVTEDE